MEINRVKTGSGGQISSDIEPVQGASLGEHQVKSEQSDVSKGKEAREILLKNVKSIFDRDVKKLSGPSLQRLEAIMDKVDPTVENMTQMIQKIRQVGSLLIETEHASTEDKSKVAGRKKDFDEKLKFAIKEMMHEFAREEKVEPEKYDKYIEDIFKHKPGQPVRLDTDQKRDLSSTMKLLRRAIQFLTLGLTFIVDYFMVHESFPAERVRAMEAESYGLDASSIKKKKLSPAQVEEAWKKIDKENGVTTHTLRNGSEGKYVLHKTSVVEPLGTVVYFHGNADRLSSLGNKESLDKRYPGYNVIVLEYPGYSRTQGPSNKDNIEKVTNEMYDAIKKDQKNAELFRGPVVAMGYSIGGYFAAKFANDHDECKGLILQNTYTQSSNIKSLELLQGPLSVLSDQIMDTESVLKHMRPDMPLVISYAYNDSLFDYKTNGEVNIKSANAIYKGASGFSGTHGTTDTKSDLEQLQAWMLYGQTDRKFADFSTK